MGDLRGFPAPHSSDLDQPSPRNKSENERILGRIRFQLAPFTTCSRVQPSPEPTGLRKSVAMAASSLARQLGALQPEKRTRRGQASLLFDDREAEKYDVQTIFEIGLAGFSELCRADAQFRQWESSLFSTSAAEFDRDLQTAEVNATLDASLSSFFKALCPHYLQRGAHKAMEFLIRRFR